MSNFIRHYKVLFIAIGLGILVMSVGVSLAGTTIGTNVSTDGNFTINGNTTIGDASTDTVTLNSTATFNTDLDVSLAGSENLTVTHDLTGQSQTNPFLFSVIPSAVNPSDSVAGFTVQQRDNSSGAAAYGLDTGLAIVNQDTDVAVTNGITISILAGGANYTTGLNISNSTTGISIGASTTGISFGAASSAEISFSDSSPVLMVPNAGYITISDGTDSLITLSDAGAFGSILAAKVLKNKTQTDSPYSVLPNESNVILTNAGASGTVVFNLPTAQPGQNYTFANMVSGQTLAVNPPSNGRIRDLTNADGDQIQSDTQYESITIMAVNSTDWIVESCYIIGTPTTSSCFGGTTVGWADGN